MSKLVLKPGYKSELVSFLQDILGLRQDGIFGPKTKSAVIAFQKRNGLKQDGIVGPMTWDALEANPLEYYADTDTLTSASWIKQHPLPEGEYVETKTPKKWIFLHHTAGRHNPYKTINGWARDQRGRIGTHYVIGGLDSRMDLTADLNPEETKYDGNVVQAIDDQYWAYHLGPVKSARMHKCSLSIELCSAGILKKEDDGTFRTWYNTKVHPSQVAVLDKPFRDSIYYHKYTNKQIKSLKALLVLLKDKHDIDLHCGIVSHLLEDTKDEHKAFEYNENMSRGRVVGLLSHTNVRSDKSDVFPQKELIEMLSTL